ncbi:pyridoxamine 5'-phosphate oxidase family protein [Streptomyces sp. NPDC055239]
MFEGEAVSTSRASAHAQRRPDFGDGGIGPPPNGYAPGGDIWIHTAKGSRKHELIEKAGRFTLMADRLEPTARYVSVEAPVISTVPATRAHLTEMTSRYLPPDWVDGYIEFAEANHGEGVVITIRPEHWISSGLGNVWQAAAA